MDRMASIGLIGRGMVGTQIAYDLNLPDEMISDPAKGYDSAKAYDADVVFVAIYLAYNGYLQEEFEEVSKLLFEIKSGALVVIKMTLHPGTTDQLQELHPDLRLVHNPEFLTEATARQDYLNPDVQVLGFPGRYEDVYYKNVNDSGFLFSILPRGKYSRIVTSSVTSELMKLTINGFYSMKNAYFNTMFDTAEKLGANYEAIEDAVGHSELIGPTHAHIFHKGGRGFGGRCLPKDFNDILDVVHGHKLQEAFRLIEEYNNGLLDKYPKHE